MQPDARFAQNGQEWPICKLHGEQPIICAHLQTLAMIRLAQDAVVTWVCQRRASMTNKIITQGDHGNCTWKTIRNSQSAKTKAGREMASARNYSFGTWLRFITEVRETWEQISACVQTEDVIHTAIKAHEPCFRECQSHCNTNHGQQTWRNGAG